MTRPLTTPAADAPIEELIAYVRRCYDPNGPTGRLLAAFLAQRAELERLRAIAEGPRVPRFDPEDYPVIERLS